MNFISKIYASLFLRSKRMQKDTADFITAIIKLEEMRKNPDYILIDQLFRLAIQSTRTTIMPELNRIMSDVNLALQESLSRLTSSKL